MKAIGMAKKQSVRPHPQNIVNRYRLHLPTMSYLEIRNLNMNCLGKLDDTKQRRYHQQASQIKRLINEELARRGKTGNLKDFFKWPSTEAHGGSGTIVTEQWQKDGLLSFMGYHVGESSDLAPRMRQLLLADIFYVVLPRIPIFPDSYLRQFGSPKSAQRLQKMAETIAAFIRNAKRRGSKMNTAIKDWEHDLDFLYCNYYVAHFHFEWPSTKIL